MTTKHTPADDIVYDLVSVQYHALQGAENNDKFTRVPSNTTMSGSSSEK